MSIPEVSVQPVLAGEGLPTRTTHKRFVPRVNTTVTAPLGLVAEEFAAKRALVHRPPPSSTLPPSATLQRI